MQLTTATNPAGLDRGVSGRQSFGDLYKRPRSAAGLAKLVKAGTVRLPPHPEWTGDLTDWAADPFEDANWQFQHHTLRWLNALRWCALDGDADSAREWRRVVRSWATTNIPAQNTPSAFAWKDMTDGNRAIQLALGAPLIEDRDHWYVPLLQYHVDWLLDGDHIAARNHALHQHAGLLVAAAALRDRGAIKVAYDRMVKQFATTFDDEGANDEGSVGYHEANLLWWSEAWSRVSREGLRIPEWVASRLEAGGEALAHFTMPNGVLPQIGDTKRSVARKGLGPFMEFVSTNGAQGVSPSSTAAVFQRGYIAVRSGWGERQPYTQESHALLRFGEDIRGHSHQDRGSIHLYTRGRPWLVDSGYYSYQTGDPTRDHFLSRAAHNVATIPSIAHNDQAPVVLERFDVTEDSCDIILLDTGYQGIELRRRVVYLPGPDCWFVWDEASQPLSVVQTWHVDAGLGVRPHDRGYELRANDDESMLMTWLGETPRLSRHIAKKGSMRGWIATKWKNLERGVMVSSTARNDLGRSVVAIAPSSPQDFSIVRSSLSSDSSLTARLARGPRMWDFSIKGSNVSIRELTRNWS